MLGFIDRCREKKLLPSPSVKFLAKGSRESISFDKVKERRAHSRRIKDPSLLDYVERRIGLVSKDLSFQSAKGERRVHRLSTIGLASQDPSSLSEKRRAPPFD